MECKNREIRIVCFGRKNRLVRTLPNFIIEFIFLIRSFWANERPTSTENETGNDTEIESEIENVSRSIRNLPEENLQNLLQSARSENRRLQYQIKNDQKNLKDLEKEIKQLKLELQAKDKELEATNGRLIQQEIENRKLEIENQKNKDDLKVK